jgi:coenzyme F420-reducing hydrogenase delta subunit/Fe-S-cluster-containing hydrogenase component 2
MCSGRVDLAHILRAFAKGADGVFIGGCRLGECNYITHGNYHALNLTLLGKKILEHIGLNPRRLQIEFMSGGEGNLFVEAANDFCKTIKELGPLAEAEGIDVTELGETMAEITRLVPYIKIEKHTKLTARLENETDYDNHFTGEEIERLLGEVASYYIDPDKCRACMICSRRCPVDAIDGAKNLIHIIDQDKCIKCSTCLDVCPSRFGAVAKMVGGPVPPPIAEEERTISKTGGTKEKKNTSSEKAMP